MGKKRDRTSKLVIDSSSFLNVRRSGQRRKPARGKEEGFSSGRRGGSLPTPTRASRQVGPKKNQRGKGGFRGKNGVEGKGRG